MLGKSYAFYGPILKIAAKWGAPHGTPVTEEGKNVQKSNG